MCGTCKYYYEWLLRQIFLTNNVPFDVGKMIGKYVYDDEDIILNVAYDESVGRWDLCIHKEDRGDYWADFYCELDVPCHYND